LHGVSEWEPPQTSVAWRAEVEWLSAKYAPKQLQELLEDYPLKPHEELQDRTTRVFEHLEVVAERDAKREPDKRLSAWVIDSDGTLSVYPLATLAEKDKNKRPVVNLGGCTVVLPPNAGGLQDGLLNGDSRTADDVADDWFEDADKSIRRRHRVHSDDPKPTSIEGMRLVCTIDTRPDTDEEQEEASGKRFWHWYVRPTSADDDGSKTSQMPIGWQHHTDDVEKGAKKLADAFFKDQPNLHEALVVAARFHDLGKKRIVWQKSIGNPTPTDWHAKSGKDPKTGRVWKPLELTQYRHEFGSLIDLENELEFKSLSDEQKELVRHLIAVHHGYGRPHFPTSQAFDPERPQSAAEKIAREVPRRFARLQRQYGRWGLAYLESLLRSADWAASAKPSKDEES
jgi:CRISPR-associated endonuclease/helicase Cas3